MALIGQIGQISSVLGDALSFASSFKQPQVSITEKPPVPGLKISVPVIGKNTVILEVVETEDMTMGVNITDKPVGDVGSGLDYISRNPPIFTIHGLISNRNLDVLSDPLGFALSRAGAAVPQVASTINQAAQLGGQFVDLGGDAIDNKIKQLVTWMLEGTFVYPVNVRLNINNWIQDTDLINWIIRDVNPNHSLDTGDGVGFDIIFKGLVSQPADITSNKHGGILQKVNSVTKSLGGLNPFGGL